MSSGAERRAAALPRRRPRLAAARPDDGGAGPARRSTALRRVGRARRRRGGCDRGGHVAWRRIDAHAGDAQLARRARAHGVGGRLLPGLPGGRRAISRLATTSMPISPACDFLAVALDEVKASFARFGLEEGVTFVPGFFQDTLPTLAGAAVGDRPAGRRQLRGDSAARWRRCIRTCAAAAISSSTTTSRSTSAARPSTTFAARTGSRNRSSTSTGAARGGGVRPSPPRCPRGGRRRRRPAAGSGAGRARWSAGPEAVPAVEEMELRQEASELRARLEAAEREIEALRVAPLRRRAPGASRHRPTWGAGRSLIVFGSAITDPDAYRRYAEPGIELVREPDSVVFANGPGGIAVSRLQPDPRPGRAAR